MSVQKVAGRKLYIGGAFASPDADVAAGDFTSQTWVEIGNTTNLGTGGDTKATITSDEINRGRTRMTGGTKSGGTRTVVCNRNTADAGQTAMLAAFDANSNYAFREVYPDAPVTGSSPAGTTKYFVAEVMSATEDAASANSFATISFNLGVNSNQVVVPASSGS